MQDKAYTMWNKFKNADFPEKYCHFSGVLSNGETSMNKPILKKQKRSLIFNQRFIGKNPTTYRYYQ